MEQINHTNIVTKLYHGEISLFRTVWVFGVIGNIIFIVLFMVLEFEYFDFMTVIFNLLFLAFNLIFMCGAWEAADKYKGPHRWVAITKSFVTLGYFIWFVGVFRFIDKVLIPFIVL